MSLEPITLSASIQSQVECARLGASDLIDSDPERARANRQNLEANLELLRGSPYIIVRAAVAGSAFLSPEDARVLSLDESDLVQIAIARNNAVGFSVHLNIVRFGFATARTALAATTGALSLERLLARDRSPAVRLALASKTNLDPLVIDLLIADHPAMENTDIYEVLAAKTNLSGSAQIFLSSPQRTHAERLILAANTSVSESTLIRLAEHQSVAIQQALLANSALTANARYVTLNLDASPTPTTPTTPTIPPSMMQLELKSTFTAASAISAGTFVTYSSSGVSPITSPSDTLFGYVESAAASGAQAEVTFIGEVTLTAHAEVSVDSPQIFLIVSEITSGDGSVGQITTLSTGANAGKVIDVSNAFFLLENFAAGESGKVFIEIPGSRSSRGPAGPTGPVGPMGPMGAQGAQGSQGDRGEAGPSFDGNLAGTLTLSNPTGNQAMITTSETGGIEINSPILDIESDNGGTHNLVRDIYDSIQILARQLGTNARSNLANSVEWQGAMSNILGFQSFDSTDSHTNIPTT